MNAGRGGQRVSSKAEVSQQPFSQAPWHDYETDGINTISPSLLSMSAHSICVTHPRIKSIPKVPSLMLNSPF